MAKRARKREPGGTPSGPRELTRALRLLEARRAPYTGPIRQIVRDTFERFAPPPGRQVLEIGAGAGQLAAWLPPEVAARAVFSDPSSTALRDLRAQLPAARSLAAAAERLPLGAATVDAVVGLCAFDALADQGAAVAEAARVLAPGGRFIHFLDMATLLEAPFAKLARAGLVPIPNVLADPGEHEWPRDLLLLDKSWLSGLLELARRAGHPLATGFDPYFDLALGDPFDADAAARAFRAVASSGPERRNLALGLVTASRVAAAHGYPALAPRPFHSGKYLQSLIETTFTDSGAFDIERSEITTAHAIGPAEPGIVYRSLCLGHQRLLDHLPARRLTNAAAAPAGGTLIEVGVYVFAARRR